MRHETTDPLSISSSILIVLDAAASIICRLDQGF